MKITRFVRMQLIIFTVVTVISMLAISLFYIRIPAMVGVGIYRVEVSLPSSGGLYENANVSYRGVNVGKVQAVRLTDDGVVAELAIDSSADIPAGSAAAVRSVSAIGEQYVEFTPGEEHTGALADGDVIDSADVPVEISAMLDQADALLAAVGDTQLRSLMDEAFVAFNGTGDELARLLDSMVLFVGEANANADETIALIRQSGPLLATQSRTAEQIRSWTRDITGFTDQLRANRPEITDILARGPGTASSTRELFASMDASLPMLFSNLGTQGRTMAQYLPNLEQIVVLYPRVLSTLYTSMNTGSPNYGANVNFSLGFQDPGTCTVGFVPWQQWRGGAAQEPQDLPPGMLCRVPQDAQVAVRGARNFPCVEFPGRRAPTPQECRTGYVPDGEATGAFPEGLPFGLQVPGEPAVATPSNYETTPAVYGTHYDPKSGLYIGPDGNTYDSGLGEDAKGNDATPSTWQSMITRTVE